MLAQAARLWVQDESLLRHFETPPCSFSPLERVLGISPKGILACFSWLVGIKLVVYLTSTLITGDCSWSLAFHRFDSYWYSRIAEFGYVGSEVSTQALSIPKSDGNEQSPWAFFPAYPACAALLSSILAIDIPWSMEVLSWITVPMVALLYFRWSSIHLPQERARSSTYVYLAFPFTIFLFFHYSDGLYVAAFLGAMIAADREHRWISGLILAFAVLVRPNALFLLPAMALYNPRIVRWKDVEWKAVFKDPGVWQMCIPPMISFVLFSLYQRRMTGDPMAFATAQAGWGRSLSYPWHGFFRSGDLATQFESVYTVALIGICALLWHRLSAAFRIMLVVGILAPLLSGSVDSITRFSMAFLPLFLVISRSRSFERYYLWLIISFAILQLGCVYLWCTGNLLMA